MKAIKIASGVAVSALALAISAQANAAAHEGSATETEWSFTGSMEFLTVIDMAPPAGLVNGSGDEVDSVIDVELDEEDDFDEGAAGDAWGLEAELSVVHGPFSGVLGMRNNDGTTTVFADDIVITDGAISFGQVGSLVDHTQDYAYDMDDSVDNGANSDAVSSEGKDVGAGLRYTMDGLKVQVEGENQASGGDYTTTAAADYGVAAQYMGEADAVSYVVEAQLRTSSLGGDDDSPYTYLGAGVTYTMDMITAKAGFNTYTVTATDANDESILEYGFELTATPVEGLSVYLKGQDLDSGDTNTEFALKLLAGASFSVDALKFTGEYLYNDLEDGNGDATGDEIMGRVDYTAGAIAAYGEVTLKDIDGDAQSPLIEAGVNLTQENGVKYSADWDMQADGDYNTEENNIRLSAAYAF